MLGRCCALIALTAFLAVPFYKPDPTVVHVALPSPIKVERTPEVLAKKIAAKWRVSPEKALRIVKLAKAASARHGVDELLALSVIATESDFRERARSGYGAVGLMQVVPRWHPEITKRVGGVEALKTEKGGIEAGVFTLKSFLNKAPEMFTALHRYNGAKKGDWRYVGKVLANYEYIAKKAS